MKPPAFEYERPTTVGEVVEILATDAEAKILAGGQSLVPMLNMRLAYPSVIVDINAVGGLERISHDAEAVRVGSLVRQGMFERSETISRLVPLAASAVRFIGHFVTRNQGTVAGSLAHADSRGELPVVLVALNGSVEAVSVGGTRQISASDLFLTHYTTSLADDEMIVESSWPVYGAEWGFGFSEFAQRHGDYALGMVACAVRVTDDTIADARIVAGSVADRPLVLAEAMAAVSGSRPDEQTLREAAGAAMDAVSPSDDIHAPAEYKRHLTGVLVRRALQIAWDNAAGTRR